MLWLSSKHQSASHVPGWHQLLDWWKQQARAGGRAHAEAENATPDRLPPICRLQGFRQGCARKVQALVGSLGPAPAGAKAPHLQGLRLARCAFHASENASSRAGCSPTVCSAFVCLKSVQPQRNLQHRHRHMQRGCMNND